MVQSLDESNKSTNENIDSNEMIIQKLLDEIQLLKNKISDLEQRQDSTIHQTVLDQRHSDSLHFVNWISNYIKGNGYQGHPVKSFRSIPVNALNEPNSYTDINNALSQGRNGQVTLGFSEPVSGKLIVYEASGEKNIQELTTIEVQTGRIGIC